MKNNLGYDRHFDALYFSYELGVLKPTADYFKRIVEKIELQPAHILFFDDYEESVVSGRRLGINTEVYRGYREYIKTIKDYGLTT